MNIEDSVDIIAIAVIALAVAFIVYEVKSAVTSDSTGVSSGLWGAGAGALAVLFLL